MLLYKIALVFALEVCTPVYGILELLTVLDGFFQDLHCLGVGNLLECNSKNAAKPFDKAVVVFVVQELEVVHAVVKGVLYKVFYELLCKGHVVVNVVERHFRLYHPELCQVAGSVGVFCAEGRTEGVDFAYGCCSKLAFKLAAYGKGSLLAKEILAEVYFTVVYGYVCKVHGSNLEHIACTLCVRLGDKGSMKIYKTLVVEEFMDGKGHCVTDTKDGTEGVCPEPHVCNCPEVLKCGILLLEREAHRIAFAQNLNL